MSLFIVVNQTVKSHPIPDLHKSLNETQQLEPLNDNTTETLGLLNNNLSREAIKHNLKEHGRILEQCSALQFQVLGALAVPFVFPLHLVKTPINILQLVD